MKNWLAVIALGAFALSGCKESATDPITGKATLRIYLTDAVAHYDAVNITFTEVSAHIDSAWLVLNNQTQTVNLLEWNNGKTLLLGEAEVEAGTYTQIRLKIQDASVVWNGQIFPMNVPSGAQSGLKLLTNFGIAAGSTYDLVLDFDAERSVVATGPRNKPNGFILKPTIRYPLGEPIFQLSVGVFMLCRSERRTRWNNVTANTRVRKRCSPSSSSI